MNLIGSGEPRKLQQATTQVTRNSADAMVGGDRIGSISVLQFDTPLPKSLSQDGRGI
ncbi:MAG: hypothetical protein F6K30_04300 [Cyanothece sp. SIO2G6]|nr:hypothetical protein [Cyanothece sp. SIO2G6]